MTAESPPNANDLAIAFTVLSEFLGTANLTTQLAQAESELVQTTADDAGAVAAQHGFTQELLDANLLVRSKADVSTTSSTRRLSPWRCRTSSSPTNGL